MKTSTGAEPPGNRPSRPGFNLGDGIRRGSREYFLVGLLLWLTSTGFRALVIVPYAGAPVFIAASFALIMYASKGLGVSLPGMLKELTRAGFPGLRAAVE